MVSLVPSTSTGRDVLAGRRDHLTFSLVSSALRTAASSSLDDLRLKMPITGAGVGGAVVESWVEGEIGVEKARRRRRRGGFRGGWVFGGKRGGVLGVETRIRNLIVTIF